MIQDRLGQGVHIKPSVFETSISKELANGAALTTDVNDILTDPEIDIVVEVIGVKHLLMITLLKH